MYQTLKKTSLNLLLGGAALIATSSALAANLITSIDFDQQTLSDNITGTSDFMTGAEEDGELSFTSEAKAGYALEVDFLRYLRIPLHQVDGRFTVKFDYYHISSRADGGTAWASHSFAIRDLANQYMLSLGFRNPGNDYWNHAFYGISASGSQVKGVPADIPDMDVRNWHEYVLVFNDNRITWYVDGVFAYYHEYDVDFADWQWSQADITIGARFKGGTVDVLDGYNYYTGTEGAANHPGSVHAIFDNVRIWDDALSEIEIINGVENLIPVDSVAIEGDLDGDGALSTDDLNLFRTQLGKREGDDGYNAAADLDGDGLISRKDYGLFYARYQDYQDTPSQVPPAANEPNTPSISINAADVGQSIVMMGGDMERSGGNLINASNPEEIIDWLIDDIPFDTWRIAYNKNQEIVEGVKNWAYYDDELFALNLIKQANPDIKFFATLESDYNGYRQGNRNNLPTWIYDYAYDRSTGEDTGTRSFDAVKYGLFLADYVEFMDNAGFPLTYLATSKEYVGVITADRAKIAIQTLIDELNTRGVAVPLLVDAGTWSLSSGVSLINKYEERDMTQYMYGYSSHNYWSSETKTWADFISAANNVGKYAFNEESSHGGGGKATLEANFDIALGNFAAKTEMYASGLQGEAIFELWPRGFNEIQENNYYSKPIFFDNGSKGRRMRAYYLVKKFATNAVDSQYIKTESNSLPDVSTMAFSKNGKITLWVINNSDTDYNKLDFNVTQFGLESGMDLQKTYWDEFSDITGVVSQVNMAQDDHFVSDIKARSINVFEISANYSLQNAVRVNDGNWATTQMVTVEEGDTVDFSAQSRVNGDWLWTGPQGYQSSQKDIRLTNIGPTMAGDYFATYTGKTGVTSQIQTRLQVSCTESPNTTARHKINGGAWSSGQTNISVTAGDALTLSPLPNGNERWHWTGPNGFSSENREVTFDSFSADMTGHYQATYTSVQGCSTTVDYYIAAECSIPALTPRVQINEGGWTQANNVTINEGETLRFSPLSSVAGSWHWTGPSNLKTIEVRALRFDNFEQAQLGTYQATFTSVHGCSNQLTWQVALGDGECTKPKITPYIRVNNGAWAQTSEITVSLGDTVDIGPQPVSGGSWQWIGPNGFSSDIRQIKLTNIQAEQVGQYQAIYTDSSGCQNDVLILINQ
ncbi:hypothetical protein [Gayadomonas joobiniege]|uniref:hypothetical protein n=1 Tax=Gayadomonas joobiniege TaxID=1234606 RepID=UPI000371128D|nr:hypothetical protein [Gayadomonas joobiniege]